MLTLLILYAACSALLMALSIPLLIRAVPPNPIYGFRVAPAFDSDRIWYATNHYAAKWLIGTGAGTLATAVALYLVPGLSIDAYAIACLAAFVLVLLPGMVLSWRLAVRLKANPE